MNAKNGDEHFSGWRRSGSTGYTVVLLHTGPAVPLRVAICSICSSRGAEKRPENAPIRAEKVELGSENLGNRRSTPETTDLWIKTTKNSTNPEIKFRAIF